MNLALGLLVLSRNHKHCVNRSFSAFAIAVAGWTASATLVAMYAGTEVGLFWARCAFLTAGLSVFFLFLFFQVFPFRDSVPRNPTVALFSTWAVLIFALSFSPWVVTQVQSTSSGFAAHYGVLYPFFALYIVAIVGYSLSFIVRKARSARGLARQQWIYLILALIVPGVAAIITNLFIPLLTGSSYLSQYGPMFSVAMISMIAHAIIRHRFLDIRVVIRRGVVYLLATLASGALFALAVTLIATLQPQLHDVQLSVQVFLALAIALAFQPLKRLIQSKLDQYVYRETYDYQEIIRDTSRRISATLDLETLLDYLCQVTSRTLRPEFVVAFARSDTGATYLPVARWSFTPDLPATLQSSVHADAPLPLALTHIGGPILRDDRPQATVAPDYHEATKALEAMSAELAIPLISESTLVGILVLGPKLSGDAYFTDDVAILSTLSNQAAIAVNNAQLYRQVVLANEHIENILRTMDSGVIAVDAVGHVTISNSTADLLTGLHRLPRGATFDQLPLPLHDQLAATLGDGIPRLQVEATIYHDGRQVPIVCSTSALRDNRGTIRGALAVFSDLSKLKALEQDKRRAERLASFSTLVSGIAHEIKNPLVAIRTFAELLPERFQDTDFREDFSKVVMTEIDRIDDLVARLRGLAAPSPPSIGAIDITGPINDTLTLLRGQLEQTRTTVHREFADRSPYVYVDAAQLKQLFLNICLNSLEAMGTGGHLNIAVTRRVHDSGSTIVVQISDTGPGIPEHIRPHIFDPFFTTKPTGSGLGLAICRGITDAHKGLIRVEPRSAANGTTITVEFPAAAADSPAAAEAITA